MSGPEEETLSRLSDEGLNFSSATEPVELGPIPVILGLDEAELSSWGL